MANDGFQAKDQREKQGAMVHHVEAKYNPIVNSGVLGRKVQG